MKYTSTAALLISVCLLGMGDPAYPPIFTNMTRARVHFVLKWRDGPDQPVDLPQGSSSFQRIPQRHLIGIVVTSASGEVRRFDEESLNRLGQRNPATREVWIATKDGLNLQH